MPEESKTRVAVVMGGVSSEHDISLLSGRNVCNGLPRGRFQVRPVVITRENRWLLYPNWLEAEHKFESMPAEIEAVDAGRALAELVAIGIDCVFIALHGPGGEDGVIQGFFQTAGIPYTGSGVLGNAVGMDKIISKRLMMQLGIPTAPFLVADSDALRADSGSFIRSVEGEIGYPCVAKVANEGSSHNMGIAADEKELNALLERIALPGKQILVEEFVSGRELTCAVIDRVGWERPRALPPTELVPQTSSFFDFEAKYTPGATEEITPAPIGGDTTARVQQLALSCHSGLLCSGMSRTDMIMRESGDLVVLEINTIPGLTETSLIPQAAAAAGISFAELLEMQVEWAIERHGRR